MQFIERSTGSRGQHTSHRWLLHLCITWLLAYVPIRWPSVMLELAKENCFELLFSRIVFCFYTC